MEDRKRMGAPEAEEEGDNVSATEISKMTETKDPSDIWGGKNDVYDIEGNSENSGKFARKSTLMGDE